MDHHRARVLIAGPLAVFAEGFGGELERLGYSDSAAEEQLRLMAHLSRWLDGAGLGVEELTAARAEEFLAYRRACGRTHRFSTRALLPLLGFLRSRGVAPPPKPAPVVTAVDRLIAEFEQFLLRDRGLVWLTVENSRRVARSFLSGRFGEGDLRLEQLTAADVTGFMLAESARRSAGSLGNTITGLRALRCCGSCICAATRRCSWRPPCPRSPNVEPMPRRSSPARRRGGCLRAAIEAARSGGATTRS